MLQRRQRHGLQVVVVGVQAARGVGEKRLGKQ
jgi:hypothetical protein